MKRQYNIHQRKGSPEIRPTMLGGSVGVATSNTIQTKHTSGPWQIGKTASVVGRTIWRSDGDGVGYARICRNIRNENDARLIAAAPDLLEACKDLIDFNSKTVASQKIVNARKAISKAEGK